MNDAISRAREMAASLNQQPPRKGGFSDGPPAGFTDGPPAAMMAAQQALQMTTEKSSRLRDDPRHGEALVVAVKVAFAMRKTPRISKKIYVPVEPGVNFMGLLLGPRGATLKDMTERTGARIVIRGKGSHKDGTVPLHLEDEDEMHVAIDGAEEAVVRAAKEVEALLFDPQYRNEMKQAQLNSLDDPNGVASGSALMRLGTESMPGWMVTPSAPRQGETTYECRIPNGMVGLVIGRGGESVKRLQAEHGVRVQIAKEPEPPENLLVDPTTSLDQVVVMRRIALTGPDMGIESAKHEIEEILRSRGGTGGTGSSVAAYYGTAETINLRIPNDKVGLVIGKAGSTIRGIQERTGANIKVPPTADSDDPESRTLCITADNKDRANAARVEVEQLVQEEIMRQQGIATADTDIFPVPEACVGLVIGKGGETIHRIQSTTGSRVQIPHMADPNTNPPMRMVAISGPPSAREQAKFEISTLVAQHEARNGKVGFDGPVGPPPDPYAPNGALLPQMPFDPYGIPGGVVQGGSVPFPQPPVPPVPPGPPMPQGMWPPPQPVVDPYAMNGGMPAPQWPGQVLPQQQQQPPVPQAPAADPNWLAAQASIPGATPTPATTVPAGADQPQPPPQQQQQYAPEAYYEDFWNYAGWYGEEAARQAYGAYAPPLGTPPPPHITLPNPQASGQMPQQPQQQQDEAPPGTY